MSFPHWFVDPGLWEAAFCGLEAFDVPTEYLPGQGLAFRQKTSAVPAPAVFGGRFLGCLMDFTCLDGKLWNSEKNHAWMGNSDDSDDSDFTWFPLQKPWEKPWVEAAMMVISPVKIVVEHASKHMEHGDFIRFSPGWCLMMFLVYSIYIATA